LCIGSAATLTDFVSGGTWSVINGNLSDSADVVKGVNPGMDSVVYTFTNYCGTSTAGKSINVLPLPHAAALSLSDSICEEAPVVLTDSTIGGTWFSADSNSVINTDTLTGVMTGMTTVFYVVHTYCGFDTAAKQLIVKPLPSIAPIRGSDSLCVGSPVTYTDSISGGNWSLANTKGSLVVASGVVTGIHAGIDTIIYARTNTCGTRTAKKAFIIIDPAAVPAINADSILCKGNIVTLTDSVPGGSWAVSNSNAFLSGNMLQGISTGVDTITYTLNLPVCGMASVSATITIDSMPGIPELSGPSFVCIGSPITLTGSPSGGSWNSLDTDASVSSDGTLSGTSSGRDTIIYTVSNYCGSESGNILIQIYSKSQCDSINYVTPLQGNFLGVQVYPNPNNGVFTVELPSGISIAGTRIRVLDLLGKIVLERILGKGDDRFSEFNVASFASSSYYVEVTLDGVSYRTKVILIR
jgi:hypothetical protein